MTGRPPKRGAVVAVLNGLVREGVIISFETKLFDQPQAAAEIAVTLPDAEQAGSGPATCAAGTGAFGH